MAKLDRHAVYGRTHRVRVHALTFASGEVHDHRRRWPATRSTSGPVNTGAAGRHQGVATSLESVLSDNTRRVYQTQWRIFTGWCDEVGLASLPAEPLAVARYLAARAGSGASVATIRLAASAISKAHEWAKLESPCRDPGVRASLKGWGRRLSKPQRQSGALTADVLAVIRLTVVQPRRRSRGTETPEQAAERGEFDVALVVAADLGRRAALGQRQRRRQRGPLQDRRRSPGRCSSHNPRRHGSPERHPAGGC